MSPESTTKTLEKKLLELNDRATTFGVGVMMFDLNNLKHVNDTYGHEKGDEFIQAFAYCLTRILDEHSFLARYGGDEFIIISGKHHPGRIKTHGSASEHAGAGIQHPRKPAFKLRSRLRGQLPEFTIFDERPHQRRRQKHV